MGPSKAINDQPEDGDDDGKDDQKWKALPRRCCCWSVCLVVAATLKTVVLGLSNATFVTYIVWGEIWVIGLYAIVQYWYNDALSSISLLPRRTNVHVQAILGSAILQLTREKKRTLITKFNFPERERGCLNK